MNWQPSWSSCLQNSPERKLILPTMYNLYIYQITNSGKAEAMKDRINSQFPNSRYKIINNTNLLGTGLNDPDL
jgi:hypothetical protein